MNLICIPFAYEENMNSGVNVSIKGKGKIEIYLKNACVALISAKYYNPDSDGCASYKLWQMEYS